jgi:hypothetical protein
MKFDLRKNSLFNSSGTNRFGIGCDETTPGSGNIWHRPHAARTRTTLLRDQKTLMLPAGGVPSDDFAFRLRQRNHFANMSME